MASPPMNILLCRCKYFHTVPEQTVSAVRAALDRMHIAVEEVDDLCGLAARRDGRLACLAGSARSGIVACHPRAVRWLFAAAGASLGDGRAELLNMHEDGPEEIVRRLSGVGPPSAQPPAPPAPTAAPAAAIPADWKPWFPVLDYDRCIDCGQCMSFCLFGVYEADGEGRVSVGRPDNCKTNCPACARICPEAAIMFPKLDEAPINGAEPAPDAGGVAQVNLAEALGPDVYAALRSRGKERRFAPRDAREQAEAERCKCAGLQAILDKLGVSPEVVGSIAADCGSDCECHDPPPIDCGPGCECHDPPPIDCGPDCECHDPPPGPDPAGADSCCGGDRPE